MYNLSIETIEPDLLASKILAKKIKLISDTVALHKLDELHRAPDNVFTISFESLIITGISPADFIRKDKLLLDSIFIEAPVIKVVQDLKAYNAAKRKEDSTATVYERLSSQIKTIGINQIIVSNGTFINEKAAKKSKRTELKNISIHLQDILIDSSTQFANDRFLFAKKATLSAKDYMARTADSLYFFKIKNIEISGQQNNLIAKQVSFEPRYSKS